MENHQGFTVHWWKSTRSNDNFECVEVADLAPGVRGVRDSKDRSGPILDVPAGQFAALLAAIQAGQFD